MTRRADIALADTAIVGCLNDLTIERARHEVQLRDGSLHCMHRVQRHGGRSRYLRALQLMDGHTVAVFDLCRLSRALVAEIPRHFERDIPGLIAYTLRGLYPRGLVLRQEVFATALAIGVPTLACDIALEHAA